MQNDEQKNKTSISRYAKYAAIAAWPLGFLLGGLLASEQDAAGEGIAFAIGIVLGALTSLFFALFWWLFRSTRRVRFIHRYRNVIYSLTAIGAIGLVAWYVSPMLVDQQYSMTAKNYSSRELTDVEIRFAGMTIPLGNLDAKEEIRQQGLATKPTGWIVVSWTNDEGERIDVESRAGPPRWYEGGRLVVNILSEYDLHTYFVRAR